jgi:hypothetical protein
MVLGQANLKHWGFAFLWCTDELFGIPEDLDDLSLEGSERRRSRSEKGHGIEQEIRRTEQVGAECFVCRIRNILVFMMFIELKLKEAGIVFLPRTERE